jgi:hypothetical protein
MKPSVTGRLSIRTRRMANPRLTRVRTPSSVVSSSRAI